MSITQLAGVATILYRGQAAVACVAYSQAGKVWQWYAVDNEGIVTWRGWYDHWHSAVSAAKRHTPEYTRIYETGYTPA